MEVDKQEVQEESKAQNNSFENNEDVINEGGYILNDGSMAPGFSSENESIDFDDEPQKPEQSDFPETPSD